MKRWLLCLMLFAFGFPAFLKGQDLVKATLVRNYTKSELDFLFFLAGIPIQAKYDISVYAIQYRTPDVFGKPDTASGMLVFPVKDKLSWPIFCYQHGTASERNAVPSRSSFESTILVLGGTLGYISVGADYLGLGDSDGFHPYVHAKTEASAARDLILASKQYLKQLGIGVTKQVFVAGYSQGGHAAMALHRELEQLNDPQLQVAAASHMSGPYSMSGEMKKRLLSNEEYNYPGYTVYTMLSYNMAYQLYDSIPQFIKQPYAEMARQFYTGQITHLDTLHNRISRQLKQDYGKVVVRYIFQDSLISVVESGIDHKVNRALKDNDTYDWAPKAPTRLYYCKADDQVVYTNSILADSVMRARGAKDVKAIDLNPLFNHSQCVTPALTATIAFFGLFQDIQTSLTEKLPLLPIQMWPNPAGDYILLEGAPAGSEVRLLDLNGRLIRQTTLDPGQQEINLQGISPGMYAVQLLSRSGVWSGKLVKN